MTIKVISLEAGEIKRLLSYLERNYRPGTFAVPAEGSILLQSNLIIGDIKAMMANISSQTGVILDDDELPVEQPLIPTKIRHWSKDGASFISRPPSTKGK